MDCKRPSVIFLVSLVLLGFAVPYPLWSQADDENVSLGDLARSLRRSKADTAGPASAPAKPVIDNENFSQVMDQVAKDKANGTLAYSFDSTGKTFQVSSPDVTCSLSFNANATALLADPFFARNLLVAELAKLEGRAVINGDTLQVSLHNGSGWNLREITVGLTILRHADSNPAPSGSTPTSAEYHGARIMSVAQTSVEDPNREATPSAEKSSDVTVLYHLKGAAPPSATTVFQQPLNAPLAPGEDWHWAIVDAKGIPPAPELPTGPLPTGPLNLGSRPAEALGSAPTAPPAASQPEPISSR
jgi:hypothetical protein